jgi:site-specific DNA recombinase
VSQDSSGRQRSVNEQEAECRAVCEREGWLLTGVWSDNDISASRYARRKRPAWQELMEIIAGGEIDMLVMWEVSRATRDRTTWAALVAACTDQRVLMCVSGKVYDLEDPDDAHDLDSRMASGVRESGATRKRDCPGFG